MERNKSGFLALIGLVAVASLFTACKASGVGSGSDPEEYGGKSALSVNAISKFSVTYPVEAEAVGVIDQTEHTIAVSVDYGTDVTGMTVLISHTGASVSPASGTTDNDFTDPKTFTVTAVDGSTQDYTVTVTQPSPRTLVLDPLGGAWKPESGFSGLQTWTLGPGEGIALPAEPDKITNDGNFLVSWNTSDDVSGTDYLQGQHFVPDGDITLYARWALGNTWVDKEAAEAAISAAENAIRDAGGGGDTVIMVGNPSEGTAPQSVLNQIGYLMGLLDGHRVDVSINDGAGTITVTLYNIPAIQQATAGLDALVAQYNPGIIVVPKWTFVYNGTDATDGSVQSALLVTEGTYEIELEGAAGGHLYTAAGLTAAGGKGGYALGRYRFDGTVASPTELEVRVGGQGEGTAGYDGTTGFVQILTFPGVRNRASSHPGGYNGGGSGGESNFGVNGASGGGGATDVRLKSEANNMLRGHAPGSGTAYTSDATKDPRIIVAGGGGGAAASGESGSHGLANNSPMKGGNAGGTSGITGDAFEQSPLDQAVNLAVGTQTNCSGSTGTASKVALGTAGIGANGILGQKGGRGGGGGGWWGGGAANAGASTALVGAGSGGSGYTDGTAAHPEGDGVLTNPYDPSSPAYSGPVNKTIPGTVYGSGKATIRWIKPDNE